MCYFFFVKFNILMSYTFSRQIRWIIISSLPNPTAHTLSNIHVLRNIYHPVFHLSNSQIIRSFLPDLSFFMMKKSNGVTQLSRRMIHFRHRRIESLLYRENGTREHEINNKMILHNVDFPSCKRATLFFR